MRARLVASLTAALLIVPAVAATASPVPRPHHTCPASADPLDHKCE